MRSGVKIHRSWLPVLIVGLMGAACATQQRTSSPSQRSETRAALATATATGVTVQAVYGKLPLHFEANQGQSDAQVNFLARGSGYTVFLTATEAVLTLQPQPRVKTQEPEAASQSPSVLRLSLVGANPQPRVTGEDELPSKSNYFFGNDPTQWHTNILIYAKVRYQNVYPGVDLIYYGTQRQVEYDFVVAPGADPTVIRLAFDGLGGADLQPAPTFDNTTGDLVLNTAGGELRVHQPRIYQESGGVKQPIAGRYVLFDPSSAPNPQSPAPSPRQVGFQVAAYDTSKPLVIDPALVYSTYLGGSDSDEGYSIAVDAAGNAYVTGATSSIDFPTTAGAFQTSPGHFSQGPSHVFVAKLNSSGSALVYSAYIGGSAGESSSAIAVDVSGNAYITGSTASVDFPTTVGAFDTTFCSKVNSTGFCSADAFVVKFNPAGSALVYSTLLGGSGFDRGSAIAVDTTGNAYVTGQTDSLDFPTQFPLQATSGGGSCFVRSFPEPCQDAFVVKFNSTGSALLYSTYLGGSKDDFGNGIAVDPSGNAYITGSTESPNFPTTPGAFNTTLSGDELAADTFVTKLSAAGNSFLYSTYLGGRGTDEGHGIAVDASGNAYVTGSTSSTDFPTTAGAFQPTLGGGSGFSFDVFVAKLNSSGSTLVYSTYLGGSDSDRGSAIAVDTTGNAYVTGDTFSTDFPTLLPIQATYSGGRCLAFPSFHGVEPCPDAFVTKVNTAGTALIYSTYLGGSGEINVNLNTIGGIDIGNGIAVDSAGNAYVTGFTGSSEFLTVNPLQPAIGGGILDAFVAKIASRPAGIQANLESPEDGPVSGITVIRGWAFATEPDVSISSVELFIDGQSAGEIPCCAQRGDVQVAFPQFPDDQTLNSGWGIVFNWGLASVGLPHTVRVFIRSTSGELFITDTRTVTVVKPGDPEFLDQFSLAEATAGIARPNDRPGNELIVEGIVVRDKATQQQKHINARFRWFESSQSLGMVEATTVAEVASLRSFFVPLFVSLSAWLREGLAVANAQRLPQPIGFLESPEQEQVVAGIGVIRGWAFDEARSSPPLLGLVIDGQWSGHIPCCSERGDVAAAYPDQAAALHSGWGMAFNYGLLSAGHHTIGVTAEYWSYAKLLDTHDVTVVRPGGFEFLDQFDLSEATARIVHIHPWSLPDREEIRLEGVKVRDKASQQEKVITVYLRWFVSSQALGIVSSSD